VLDNLKNWLDHRTGYRKIVELLLIEHIPGGAKWRYVWGSCLAFVFSVQLITGLLLMTAYSPGDSTAWASVYYIQYEMDFGWLIRGLHHFGSQTMVVLLGCHMLQIVIAGAHLPPREVNWWLGLGLMGAVLGLSLTGYLLPWDQKGYWATQVATNIAGNLPVLGPWMQKIIVGGPVYGHHTLTRFFALHVAILPPLIVVLIIAHLAVFRRHGVTAPAGAEGEGWFWPDQAFRDMLASLIVFGVMLGLVIFGHGHSIERPAREGLSLWSNIAHAGQRGLGANLDAPADPSEPYPARPEWYFLFLFQLLKYFEGEKEIIGTVVIPGLAGLVLFVVPLLGYGRMRKFGYWFGIVLIVGLLTSVATLTYLALASDAADTPEAKLLQGEKSKAHERAARAIQLAGDGVPAEGAHMLLRRDPMSRGRQLFNDNCAGCHRLKNHFENGEKASDLSQYGSEERTRRLIMNPGHEDFFGRTELKRMAEWAEEEGLDEPDDETKKLMGSVARWLAGHPRKTSKNRASDDYKNGLAAFSELGCNDCHAHEDVEPGTGIFRAPDLTGYGDEEYLRLMIMAPDHPARYGVRNAMPVLRDLEGPTRGVTQQEIARNREALLAQIAADDPRADQRRKRIMDATQPVHLSDVDRELIIRFLLGDSRVVFGGDPITGPPPK